MKAGECALDSSGKWLDEKSPEFGYVHYLLLLSIKGKKVKDVGVWKVDNPYLTLAFEKRTRGFLTLDCWVEGAELTDENPLSEVCRRGFIVPQDTFGLSFQHGNIRLEEDDDSLPSEKAVAGSEDPQQAPTAAGHHEEGAEVKVSKAPHHHHLYALCSVGVGRTFVLDKAEPAIAAIPPGYDSLYVAKTTADRDGDGALLAEEEEEDDDALAQGSAYHHEYIVQDPTQALPRYIVRFTAINDAKQSSDGESAKGKARVDGDDPLKLYDRYDFFDPILFTPVSLRDKMVGSHSSGEAAAHKLIPIKDAYDLALGESRKEDPVLKAKRASIERQLCQLDDRHRDINLNTASIEQRLHQMLQDALSSLEEQTRQKKKALRSAEVELRRQLSQLDWVESFLEHERGQEAPLDFLRVWKSHALVKSSIGQQLSSSEANVINAIKADLDIDGKVDVVPRRHSTSYTPATSAAGFRTTNNHTAAVAEPLAIRAAPVDDVVPAATTATTSPPFRGERSSLLQRPGQPQPPPRHDPASVLSALTAGPRPRSAAELLPLARRFPQYSLTSLAERKKRQLAVQLKQADVFASSSLLSPTDAATLYYSLPFVTSAPTTTLLHTSSQHEQHSIQALHTALTRAASPTIFIIRSGDFVFGGYASDPWRTDNVRFGSPKSFLFSLTLDLKLPYHGRQRDQQQSGSGVVVAGPPSSSSGPHGHGCLCAGHDYLQFGTRDLVLRSEGCSSEVEHSFGVGLEPGSDEAKVFLAGAAVFEMDQLEVWKVQ